MSKGRMLVIVPLMFLVVSCTNSSSNNSSASGKVNYKGAPVTGGNITFYPQEGGGSYPIQLNSDGTYSIQDIPAGEFAVTVETETAKPTDKVYGAGKGGKDDGTPPPAGMAKGGGGMGPIPQGAGAASAPGRVYVKIPAKYSEKEKSGLKVTIAKGKNPDKNFDLTD